MKEVLSAVSRALASSAVLGVLGSCKLLLSHFVSHTFKIKPRHYSHPLYVRGKTSDPLLLFTICCLDEYPAKFVKSPEFIIDAGANVGYASAYFAHHFPGAKIVAIEPEPSNFEMLKANTAGYPNVSPRCAALWPRSESVAVADPTVEKWMIQCEARPGGNIPGVTVPQLLNGHKRIGLFKCDIEGAEKQVFSSAPWLAQVDMIMIEIHPGCWKSVIDALSQSNLPFDCRRSGENLIVYFDRH